MMKALKKIEKTREYLDYLEEHILNVKKAWEEFIEKCKSLRVIWDDYYYFSLLDSVSAHDISKLSENEFVQYRKAFYGCDDEIPYDMSLAWEHHKKENPHHWETWTTMSSWNQNAWEIHCAHMIIDWMAMGYKFGDTAQSYYEKNKEKIKLPDHAVEYIYEIFKCLTVE